MIEFTISRVCMSVCGLILLSAILVPVTGMYDSQARNMESNISDSLAKLIDEFDRSEMDIFILPASDILPSTSSYVEIKDKMIILTTDHGIHRSAAHSEVYSDNIFGYGDVIRMSKHEGIVIIEKI